MTFDHDLEHTLDAGLPEDHRVQVWSRSCHLRGRRSDFRASTKVPVSRDLWPWPWPWAHPGCTLTWCPSCESLVAIRPFACEKKQFAQKFTDGQTDRRRTPRHCISSFLEWAKNEKVLLDTHYPYLLALRSIMSLLQCLLCRFCWNVLVDVIQQVESKCSFTMLWFSWADINWVN